MHPQFASGCKKSGSNICTTDRKLSCVAVTLKLSMISRVSDFRERRKRYVFETVPVR